MPHQPQRAPDFKPTQVDPLAPLNIGPNTAAEQMAAVAAAAEANARALAAAVVAGGTMGGGASAAGGGRAAAAGDDAPWPHLAPPAAKAGDASAGGMGRLPPMQPGQSRLGGNLPPLGSPGKKPSEDVPSDNLIMGGARTFKTTGSMARRPAGYRSDAAPDLAAIREAAEVAAAASKVGVHREGSVCVDAAIHSVRRTF